MSKPTKITRTDRTPAELREFARKCEDQRQARRVRALAMALEGSTRADAARAAGVTLETIRNWVKLYNWGGVDGLRDAPLRKTRTGLWV